MAIDEKMMKEIEGLKKNLNPSETLFVVDSMIGQDAVLTAKTFNEAIDYDGVVLTKLDGDSGGGVALAAGPKLQMRTWTVIFDESSAFELKVTPASRDTNTYPYNGVIVGEAPPLIGDPSVLTGSFRVPVMTSNIDTKIVISSTSPLPCRFQSAEWEGFYHTRAKRQ